MRDTLKTIGILSIVGFCTFGTVGCTHERDEKVIYRDRDHRYWHRYGQADFGTTPIDTIPKTQTLAAAQ